MTLVRKDCRMRSSLLVMMLVSMGTAQCWKFESEWHRSLLRGPRPVTPKDLHKAIIEGNETRVKQLIARKVDVNSVVDSLTPVMAAAIGGDRHIIWALVRAGADVNAVDENGTTPLIFATINGHADAMQAIINLGSDVDAQDLKGRTALHWSAYLSKNEMIQILLNNGADVGVKDKENKTPYDLIGKSPDLADGETELDSALVEWLAAPSRSAAELFDAVRKEDLVAVQKIITRGADVNARLQSNGETPIIVAAALANARVVKEFTTRGGDIDAQQDNGKTALMVAAAFGNLANVEVLLDKGADPNLKDEDGNTAASLICSEETLAGECPSRAKLEELLKS